MEQTLLIMLKMIDKTCQMELGIQVPLVLCLAQVSHIVHERFRRYFFFKITKTQRLLLSCY